MYYIMYKYMKKVMMIMVLGALVACLVPAQAQTFTPAKIDNQAIQSQQIMQTGAAYEGTVYEPFSNTTPSEQSEVGSGYSPARRAGAIRKSGEWGTNQDGGEGDEGSPLGDGVWPLLLCAVVFCGVIALRRKRAA